MFVLAVEEIPPRFPEIAGLLGMMLVVVLSPHGCHVDGGITGSPRFPRAAVLAVPTPARMSRFARNGRLTDWRGRTNQTFPASVSFLPVVPVAASGGSASHSLRARRRHRQQSRQPQQLHDYGVNGPVRAMREVNKGMQFRAADVTLLHLIVTGAYWVTLLSMHADGMLSRACARTTRGQDMGRLSRVSLGPARGLREHPVAPRDT